MFDADMEDTALGKIAERERHSVAGTWQAIRDDLRKAGPFAKMILSFRASAVEALTDLAFVETQDANVLRLQAEVRRFVQTIEIIHGYRDGAAAVDANVNAPVDDDDRDFLATLEEPPNDQY